MYFLSDVWLFMCEARCSFTLVLYSHSGQHNSLGPALLFLVLFLVGAVLLSSVSAFLLIEVVLEVTEVSGEEVMEEAREEVRRLSSCNTGSYTGGEAV